METRTVDAIQGWLVGYLARLLDVDASKVDVDKPVDRYGLDSAAAIQLVAELGEWMKVELEPTIIFDYRTVRKLADHVASTSGASVPS